MSTIRKRLEDAEMVKAYRDFVQATGQLKDTHVTSCASFRYVVIPEGRDTHSRNSCEGA